MRYHLLKAVDWLKSYKINIVSHLYLRFAFLKSILDDWHLGIREAVRIKSKTQCKLLKVGRRVKISSKKLSCALVDVLVP
jgi:hypothetical protein